MSRIDDANTPFAGSRHRKLGRGGPAQRGPADPPGSPLDLTQRLGRRPGRFCVQVPPNSPADAGWTIHQATLLKEAFMFEEQPQTEIDALIKSNPEFKQLYQRHRDLDKKVMDAELGVLPIDDTTLHQMKREKLAAKDRLIRLYDSQHH